MRPEFNIQSFHEDIKADISAADGWISELGEGSYSEDEREYVTQQVENTLRRIQERLLIGLEYCGLTEAARRQRERFSEREHELTTIHYEGYLGVFYVSALDDMVMALRAFLACIGVDKDGKTSEGELRHVRRILDGTAKLIADRKLDPRNETQVRNEVYGLLLHSFPDTVRDPHVAQVSKVYKPDLGIRSLKALIEYKFADTADELKTSLEGIYADTHGYSGFSDWKHFFAVIYCTDAFMTPDQLKAELARVDMPKNWDVILVTGRGGRTKRAAAPPATPTAAPPAT